MRKPFLLICLLNFLFLLTVCTTEDAPVEVLLVDYDFTLAQQKMIFPDEAIYDPGIYWFARGWGRSEKGWFWISDTEAVLYHYLLGSKVTFALECGTVRKLAVLGLKLTVFVNGRETADFTFRDKSRVRTCVFTIPDAFVTQGLNELRFHLALPDSEKPDAGSKEANALNLFVAGLKIRAYLDRRQRAEWGGLHEGKRAESGWELVRLEGAGEEGGSRNEAKGADASSYPDVLMILLDAARPDHFGCYGYPRDTTPSIDRLAKDGIVFQEVFAPSPYTLCSVPTILTGRSWVEHGLVTGKQALAGSFPTLAEVMKRAGYFTLAISANACFSSAFHSQQGFDEFIETWKNRDHKGLDPEFPERCLSDRIAKGLGPEPAFVYLHLLPPHQPYKPGEEHDRFSDPKYRGPADGGNEIIKAFDLGKRSWNEADRRNLIDLYDGNLHRIDASVGRIVGSWRKLNRGRELLVIVFSDHGEGFGEHGRFSHNSTVYDEMVRVPLIFYPARLCPSLAGREGAFLCLSDLMPLLLHVIKAPLPPGESWPERFLEVLFDPGHERTAVLLRNYANLVGLRTRGHLALVDGWKVQELFDLEGDPGAARNIRLQEPERYAEMIGRLKPLLEPRGPGSATVEARLSEEAIENLKALGYMH